MAQKSFVISDPGVQRGGEVDADEGSGCNQPGGPGYNVITLSSSSRLKPLTKKYCQLRLTYEIKTWRGNLCVTTFSSTSRSITILSITTLSITTLSEIMKLNPFAQCHYAECHY
jgi:hypothetical protein